MTKAAVLPSLAQIYSPQSTIYKTTTMMIIIILLLLFLLLLLLSSLLYENSNSLQVLQSCEHFLAANETTLGSL